MKLTMDQAKERVSKSVEKFLEEYGASTGIPNSILSNKESRIHVLSISKSIMLNRCGFNTYPGSFVQAILDNDLRGAFNRADYINQQCIRFYVTMLSELSINISPE